MKLPKLPSLPIGALKSKLPNIKGLIGRKGQAPDDQQDFDNLDYMAPTKFQKHGKWIAVFAAYGVFFLLVGGSVLYAALSADETAENLIAARPKAFISADEIVLKTEPKPEMATEGTASDGGNPTAPAGVDSAETQGPSDPDEPAGPDNFAGLMAPHPDPALIENSSLGPLPIVGNDGREPWRVYSRPSNVLETRPKIAVVISGLGINSVRTEQALALPGSVSLAFAPYSRKIDSWISAARENGHEVLLTLPMEPANFPRSDPGPFALMSTLDEEQNTRRLEWILSRTTGYVGVASYQGSGFASNPAVLRPVLANLKQRGLLYLDGKQTGASAAPQMAASLGVPIGRADIVIDANLSRAAILKQMKLAESLARANGSVIVLGHPYPVTLDRIRVWVRELADQGLALTPISGVIADRSQS